VSFGAEIDMNLIAKSKGQEAVTNFKRVHSVGMQCLLKAMRNLGIAIVAFLVAGCVAQAAVNIGLNASYNGTPPHSSTTPWVNTLFQDLGNNTVRLTITAPNLTSGTLANPEFLQSLFLNYNDTKQVTSLTFTPVFTMWHGLANAFSLIESKNNEQASTGGKYDILLGFQTKGVPSQFNQGDQVVFDITTQPGTSLSSQDFAFLSTPGTAGSFYAAGLIQNTGINNKQSDYAGATTFTVLGVPEPVSGLATAGCCLVGLAMSLPRVRRSCSCRFAWLIPTRE
jgi:hypothetical protein